MKRALTSHQMSDIILYEIVFFITNHRKAFSPMRKFRFFCIALIALLGVSVITPTEIFAKSSSSSRSSSSRPSSSKSSSWGSSKPSSSKPSLSKPSSSKPSSSKPSTNSTKANDGKKSLFGNSKNDSAPIAKPQTIKDPLTGNSRSSAADKAAYNKAKESGKVFANKQAALTDFKSKAKSDPATQASLSKTYPTSFNTRPATRPDYIPQSYQGRPVVYDSSIGGYGYRGNDGTMTMLATYMLMDTMSDAMMVSAMSNNGYYVGTPQVVTTAPRGTVSTIIMVLFIAIIGFFGVFLLIRICMN